MNGVWIVCTAVASVLAAHITAEIKPCLVGVKREGLIKHYIIRRSLEFILSSASGVAVATTEFKSDEYQAKRLVTSEVSRRRRCDFVTEN